MENLTPQKTVTAVTVDDVDQFATRIAGGLECKVDLLDYVLRRAWRVFDSRPEKPTEEIGITKRPGEPVCLSLSTAQSRLMVKAPLEEWQLIQAEDDGQLYTELRLVPCSGQTPVATLGTHGPRVGVVDSEFVFRESTGVDSILI